MAGKPKIYVLQACQGSKIEFGVPVKFSSNSCSNLSTDWKLDTSTRIIPSDSDNIVCFSISQNYYSFRNKISGSWYIQAILSAFEESWKVHEVHDYLRLIRLIYEFDHVKWCFGALSDNFLDLWFLSKLYRPVKVLV